MVTTSQELHILGVLREARTVHKQRLQPFLRSLGLTEDQWRVLRALNKDFTSTNSGLDAKSIAQQSSIVSSSLTGVLVRMERDGLITRAKSTDDGRYSVIKSTEEGTKKSHLIAEVVQEYYMSVGNSLGKEKIDLLLSLLNDFISIGNNPSPQMYEVLKKADEKSF